VLSQEEGALHDIYADFLPRYLGRQGNNTIAMESAAMGLENASIVDISFDTFWPWTLESDGLLNRNPLRPKGMAPESFTCVAKRYGTIFPKGSWRFPWRAKMAHIWQPGPGYGQMENMDRQRITEFTPLQTLQQLFMVEGRLQSEVVKELVSEMQRLHNLLVQQHKWNFRDSSVILAYERKQTPPSKERARLKLIDFGENSHGEPRTWGLELLIEDMQAFLESGGNKANLVLPSIQDHGRREMEWYAKRGIKYNNQPGEFYLSPDRVNSTSVYRPGPGKLLQGVKSCAEKRLQAYPSESLDRQL